MKFFGQWDPQVDEVLYRNFFPEGTPPGVLIECGAADGVTESCGLFFAERDWTCVNVEPDAARFAALLKNRTRVHDVNVNLALSDHDSDGAERTFNRGPHSDHSLRSCYCTYKRLMEVLQLPKVDLFVLDVEGHELSVLKGMEGSNALPKVMCIEYPWPEVGFERLNAAAAQLGYHHYFVSHNNAFYGRNPRPEGPFFGETELMK